jgi:hypothetical protein
MISIYYCTMVLFVARRCNIHPGLRGGFVQYLLILESVNVYQETAFLVVILRSPANAGRRRILRSFASLRMTEWRFFAEFTLSKSKGSE